MAFTTPSMLCERDRALIRRENMLSREKRLRRTGISQKYWDLTWDHFTETADNRVMREKVISYGATFEREPVMHSGEGLLLIGPPGAGKTMSLSILGVLLSNAGFMVRFTSLAAYIERLQRQITLQQLWTSSNCTDEDARVEWHETDDWMHEVRTVAHMVILDDVGKEYRTKSGYAEDQFDLFLRERVRLGRPVMMTSNYAPRKWAGTYSESMASFIHEAGRVIICDAASDMRRALRGL